MITVRKTVIFGLLPFEFKLRNGVLIASGRFGSVFKLNMSKLLVSVVSELLGFFLRVSVSSAAGGSVCSIPGSVGGDLGVRVVCRNLGKLQR